MSDINEPQTPPAVGPQGPPAVPKGLLSARPPMTNVVPAAPDKVEQVSQDMDEFESEVSAPPDPAEERQERIDYLRNISSQQPKKNKVNIWVVIGLIVVGLAVAGVAYWLLTKSGHEASPKTETAGSSQTETPTQTQQPANNETPTQTQTAEMKPYQSENFAVSLKYPSNWTANDTQAKLTLVSTPMQLTDNKGSSFNGAILVTIRAKQAKLAEFSKGSATAVLPSERIKYATPAAGQRDSTYLSFLQYSGTTVKGSLDAMYITGNLGYQKGQNAPETDIVKVDPLITVSFVKCDTKCADTAEAATVSSTVWNSQLKSTIEAILKSLQIS